MSLDIVIVNFFSEELISRLIENLIYGDYDVNIDYNIIIVDNGSDKEKLDKLKHDKVIIIKSENNLGFGTACNLGVNNSKSEYILFLNPDTIVKKNTIESSVNFMSKNNDIMVLGCKQIDEEYKIQRGCSRFITLKRYLNKIFGLNNLLPSLFKTYHMNDWNHETSRCVDHVIGSFYLIRRKDFINLGGFDESFFVYYEDLDLSKRVIDSGGKIFYNSDIEIFHEGGGASKKVKAKRLFYSLDAFLIYCKKHLINQYIIIFFFVLFIEPIIRIIKSVFALNLGAIRQTLEAYRMLYKKRLF